MTLRKRTLLIYLLLITAFMFMVSAPDMPLNDDYIYFHTVDVLSSSLSLELHPAAMASAVLMGIFGYASSLLFGVSRSSATLFNMIAGLLSVAGTFLILRRFVRMETAMLGSGLLLVLPSFYNLSHTFMTDVPALMFTVFSVLFFIRAMDEDDNRLLVLGSLFATMGFYIRQFSLIPLGAAVLYLLVKDRKRLFKPVNVVFMFVVPAVVVAAWFYWFFFFHNALFGAGRVFVLGQNIANNFNKIFFYTGLSLFPLGLLSLTETGRNIFTSLGRWKKIVVGCLVLELVIWYMVRVVTLDTRLSFVPFGDLSAHPTGIGPVLLSGQKNLLFPGVLWIPILLLGLLATVVIFSAVLRNIDTNYTNYVVVVMASTGLVLVFREVIFSRYLLIIIPFFFILVLKEFADEKYLHHILVLTLVIVGFWSFYGTHDYVSWNQAKWDGIEHLKKAGVPEDSIDGGLEYNIRFYTTHTPEDAVKWYGFAYSITDEYVVSFSELDGYRTIEEIGYTDPFGRTRESIYVLNKTT